MINEKAKKEPTLAGTVSVPADINVQVFDNKHHTNVRSTERGIDKDSCIEAVKAAAEKMISRFQRGGIKNYIIADASNCNVCVCEFSPQSIEKPQTALVKTIYKYDGKAPLHNGSSDTAVIVVNEDNPCPEWEEAKTVEQDYGHLWTNGGAANSPEGAMKFVTKNFDSKGKPLTLKAYEKLMDKECPLIQYAWKKKFLKNNDPLDKRREREMNRAWDDKEKEDKEKKDTIIPPDGWEKRKLDNVDNDFLNRRDSLNRVGLKGKTTADQKKNIQMDRDWADKKDAEAARLSDKEKSIDNAMRIQNARDKNWRKQTQKAAWDKHGDYQPYKNEPDDDEREVMNNFNKGKMLENSAAERVGISESDLRGMVAESIKRIFRNSPLTKL